MRKILFGLISVLMIVSCTQSLNDPAEQLGSITGIIADKTTGEPVPVVNVYLEPGGKSTVTGSDGVYHFNDLEPGLYTISLRKEGYKDNSGKVKVVSGNQADGDLLIERIPAKMTIDKTVLDFGADPVLNNLSFSIVNSDYVTLSWIIAGLEDWIKVSPASGNLQSGKTATIVVTINRDHEKIKPGNNSSVIVIHSTSGHGSAEIAVKLIGEEKQEPAVNILSASEITSSTATLNGRITNPGVPSYTERGFFYSGAEIDPNNVDGNPAVYKVSCPVNEEISYKYVLSELQINKEYFARAYVINRDYRVISTNQITFKPSSTIPSVSIQDASGINVIGQSAVLNGTVTFAGDPVYSEKGFVYGENTSPTVYDTKVEVEGNQTGSFSVPISGLSWDKTYYARAYIRQLNKTYYSNETITFLLRTTAPVSSILQASNPSYSNKQIKISGNISNSGQPLYTRRGFVYGLTSNPRVERDQWVNVSGSGTGEFSQYLSELTTDKQYFVRVFTEQNGAIFYSANELNFILSPVPTKLGTISVSEVDNYSAKLSSSVVDGTASGTFSGRFSNLTANTTYYAKAYARQNGQTYYSSEVSFKTGKQNPVVNTNSASNVQYTTATLRATVSSVGEPAYNRRGFYYGLSSSLTDSNSTITLEEACSQGDFSKPISGLEENTTYYYKAYVIQPGETTPIFGSVASFTTGRKPNVTTGGYLNVTCTGTEESNLNWSATLYGGVSDSGDPAYTTFGFVYGTSSSPTVNDGSSTYFTTSNYDMSGSVRVFSSVVSGFRTGVHYYFRAVAATPLGYVYGEPIEFTPAVISPVIRTYSTDCQYVNNNWAVAFNGVAAIGYGQPFPTGYGFVYSYSNSNPTVGGASCTSVAYTAMKQNDTWYIFGAMVQGLTANKTYYVRAYAKTVLGYTYGETQLFFTF